MDAGRIRNRIGGITPTQLATLDAARLRAYRAGESDTITLDRVVGSSR